MKIKICGLTRMQDVESVNEAMPDYVGFVFAESRRKISVELAVALKKNLNSAIEAVGVFVNAEPADIVKLCNEKIIDLVQLHGDEDADYIESLKRKITCPIIKAIRVQNPEQLLQAQMLLCDYLLLDTYHKECYGGSGVSFDYALIPKLEKPFFLAGGLNAGNIAKAAEIGPFCLDISSGAETDGFKDGRKIKELMKIIRGDC